MKKIFLLLVIIGLAFSYPLATFAEDDDDQGYNDECAPLIESVHMNFVSGVMFIWGEFCVGEDPPEVTLCRTDLTLIEYSPFEIVADASYDPEGACVLSVCTEEEDDSCDYFWLAPAPGGPDGQPPALAWYGAVISHQMAPDSLPNTIIVDPAAHTVHLKLQIDGNDVEGESTISSPSIPPGFPTK